MWPYRKGLLVLLGAELAARRGAGAKLAAGVEVPGVGVPGVEVLGVEVPPNSRPASRCSASRCTTVEARPIEVPPPHQFLPELAATRPRSDAVFRDIPRGARPPSPVEPAPIYRGALVPLVLLAALDAVALIAELDTVEAIGVTAIERVGVEGSAGAPPYPVGSNQP